MRNADAPLSISSLNNNDPPSRFTRRSSLAVIGAASAAAGLATLGRAAAAGSPPPRPNNGALSIDGDALVVDDKGNVGIGKQPSAARLAVNGTVEATGLTVNGTARVTKGIQNGEGTVGTNDLGLYSRGKGNYLRFVTDNGPIHFYTDGGDGKNPVLTIGTNGHLFAEAPVNAPKFVGSGTELTGLVKTSGGTMTGPLTITVPQKKSLALAISGNNYVEFGAGVKDKQGEAGKIAYQVWSKGLDIVGAGENSDFSDRKITLHAQGGLEVAGPIMLKDGQQIVDVIDNQNNTNLKDKNNRINKHLEQKLAGKPVGTLVLALCSNNDWPNHIFFGLVRADKKRQIGHFEVVRGDPL